MPLRQGERVNSDQAIQLFSQLMWNAALIAAPVLLATLAIGLLVSVFQAVTQIQEMSLTFIPKLIGTGIVLVAAGPWMLSRLIAYSASLISGIPRYF
jgi:flagellar biosynthetic protein FliQ